MKKIVVINGHPDSDSFNEALAQSYIKSSLTNGADIRYVAIGALNFNPNLQFGYRQRMDLEPDLVKAFEDIQWSQHQVWIHPLWWMGMPAIMKGFIDRLFLPGLAFKSDKNGISTGLLSSKTARIITTSGDLSLDTYEEIYHSWGLVQLGKGILRYCGVSSIQSAFIGPLHHMDRFDRAKYLEYTASMAFNDINITSST
ncbi:MULTISPECIES: NAD(P)H-dependent oxidoreductase [unclassified Sphingobacterium]|uniref:NAD(P)H-dependent oxidoreductase n=1 Tax=unclassified Sphingobacterium TaxID=2609468 RepID=UPI0025E40D7A|nr:MULTISPECIES: NAD(P)H-dependent oxidoreductase [unclassified Sphingobacterium]